MKEISIKSIVSILATKFTLFLTKTILKGGTTFPGRVALKLDNNILSKVSKGYKVILVTGTNGKTTTTSMIYNILKEKGLNVITNNTGANLFPGIVTTFVGHYKFFNNKGEDKYAVIEVDEANLKYITKYLTPEIITVTNLFRDQLDRYGEVYTTLTKILEGITLVPETKLVLNGDESLLGKLDVKNPCIFYGFKTAINENKTIDVNADSKFCKFCKTPYSYNFVTYNHLGDYYCTGCGYTHPQIKYGVDKIIELTAESSTVKFGDTEIFLGQSGVYNIYNALCAYAITKELNVDDATIKKSLESQSSSFGRQEIINIDDKEVKIILVKNPAGYNQALDTLCLNKDAFSCAFLLNDNYADGRDVSWIWDVNFENLANVKLDEVYVSGMRSFDMAVRLKTAGLSPSSFVIEEEYEGLTEKIKNGKNKKLYILATYTAMINYRKYLHSKGYIKNLW
ncbi:Mur ligase family protein [Clostridium celatum]|uniref:Mur ligase family protein n=1 Tax=Clostridium celatum TaxID=36834 RepID=UPI00059036CD|nr:Mur ligase family protein [Clostridium celatum]MCE9654294.1 Mur ligase family protein [Clostridium celatum]MDU6297226.1 Mur ligase family protein [Clostridium celatum]MDY3358981.1 Mur ligase family protein [Clostridium celatum]